MSPRDLSAELDADVTEFWKPNPGDKLIGTLVGFDTVSTRRGPARTALIRDDSGRVWSVFINHVVLAAEFARANPQPGDRVGIRMLETPTGKAYKNYKVVHEPAEGPAPGRLAERPGPVAGSPAPLQPPPPGAPRPPSAAPGAERGRDFDLASFSEPDWT